MSFWSTVAVALKALRRNPTRAALTTLGIVIGISAVITMMEIGKGSSTSIRQSIEKMGANAVLVRPGGRRTGGISQGSGSSITRSAPPRSACFALINLSKQAGSPRWTKLPLMQTITLSHPEICLACSML